MNSTARNLIVGQSGGCTAVINSSLVGAIQEARRHPEITRIYGMLNGIQGLIEGRLVDLTEEPDANLEAIRYTPSAVLGSCRHKMTAEEEKTVLNVLAEHRIGHFIYIGGNDSADTTHRLGLKAAAGGYDLRAMAVPKTIDNDLPFTDHCPGYGSIARFVATSVLEAGRDTEATCNVHPVKIVEVMGRNAGWVAASAALGKRCDEDAPQLIYLPERPFSTDRFIEDVRRTVKRLGYVVAVVSEKLKDKDGNHVPSDASSRFTDAFGHPYFPGPASFLCDLVERELRLHARFDKPGTIQRMSMALASPVDLEEAYVAGQMAVRSAAQGVTGRMVTLERVPGPEYGFRTGLVELERIAHIEKRLPDDFITPEANFVTQAFVDYALPLVGAPLPQYPRLQAQPVSRLSGIPGMER